MGNLRSEALRSSSLSDSVKALAFAKNACGAGLTCINLLCTCGVGVVHEKKVFYDEEGKWNRDDGPAFINTTNHSWHKHGEPHRIDGPAYCSPWKDGNCYRYRLEGERAVREHSVFHKSMLICQRCEFFVDTKRADGWYWDENSGVMCIEGQRKECHDCPRILEHMVMCGGI